MTVNPGAHGDEKRTRTQLSSVSILRVQREKEELTKEPLTWQPESQDVAPAEPREEVHGATGRNKMCQTCWWVSDEEAWEVTIGVSSVEGAGGIRESRWRRVVEGEGASSWPVWHSTHVLIWLLLTHEYKFKLKTIQSYSRGMIINHSLTSLAR